MYYLLILIIIYTTFSPFVKVSHLTFIAIFLIFYTISFKLKVGKKNIFFFLVVNFYLFFHYLLKEIILSFEKPELTNIILDNLILLILLISYLISLNIKIKNIFWEEFEKIIFILACLSLIIYFIQIYDINLVMKIPKIIKGRVESIIIYNFLTTTTTFIYIPRNSGIAWEPGAFQLLLNLGFFLNLSKERKMNYQKIIYIVCIFTTRSSTGLVIILIQMSYYVKSLMTRKNIKKALFFFTIALCLIIKDITSEKGYIRQNIIIKLNLKNQNRSTLERKKHLELDVESFKKNYILGRGLSNYRKDRDQVISSNSHSRILAVYGVLFYLLYFSLLYRGLIKNIGENINLIILIIILSFMNEIIWASPLFFVIMFMEGKNAKKIM